jgi:dihydrofolate synthase/folylpolyglutamate synthase
VDGMTLGLAGAHQRANAAVALRVLQLLDARGITVPSSAIASGFADPRWPGRLELRRLPGGRELLLDAAHNPAGAASLASYLKAQGGDPPPLVLAAMRDKDVAGIFAALLPAIGSLIVTRASNARSADPAVLAQQARAIAPALPIAIEPALDKALDAAWRASPRIVVAGSIFLLGDVMKQAGGS